MPDSVSRTGARPSISEQAAVLAGDPILIPEVVYWRRVLAPDRPLPDIGPLPDPWRLLIGGEWEAAATSWATLGASYEQALALFEGGPAEQRHAVGMIASLGASVVARHFRDLLRQRGVAVRPRGPRATTRANPAGLTKRQMDVLRLLDQGCTNAEVAERLFVAPKTVDHHVSAVLTKLGAQSRGEATAIARRTNLLDPDREADEHFFR